MCVRTAVNAGRLFPRGSSFAAPLAVRLWSRRMIDVPPAALPEKLLFRKQAHRKRSTRTLRASPVSPLLVACAIGEGITVSFLRLAQSVRDVFVD